MLTVTVKQCRNAADGLAALARLAVPLPFAFRLAEMTFPVQQVVDRLNETRRKRIEELANKKPDGTADVHRLPEGQIAFSLEPEAEYQLEQEYERLLEGTTELNVTPLTRAEIPATIGGKDTELPFAIFVQLGPLFHLTP